MEILPPPRRPADVVTDDSSRPRSSAGRRNRITVMELSAPVHHVGSCKDHRNDRSMPGPDLSAWNRRAATRQREPDVSTWNRLPLQLRHRPMLEVLGLSVRTWSTASATWRSSVAPCHRGPRFRSPKTNDPSRSGLDLQRHVEFLARLQRLFVLTLVKSTLNMSLT